MSKEQTGITTVLNQACRWRIGKKTARNGKKNWPRLRVINGMFVLVTETAPLSA